MRTTTRAALVAVLMLTVAAPVAMANDEWSPEPTASQSEEPTSTPSQEPSSEPTSTPSAEPTSTPSEPPSSEPSDTPTPTATVPQESTVPPTEATCDIPEGCGITPPPTDTTSTSEQSLPSGNPAAVLLLMGISLWALLDSTRSRSRRRR